MKRLFAAAAVLALFAGCRKHEERASAPPPPPAPEKSAAAPAAARQATVTLSADAPIPPAGVALWLIGDDAAAGAANGKVESWSNPRIPGIAAKAASAEARPSIAAGALNGHAAVSFDGQANMLMTNVDTSPAAMPEATILSVFSSRTAEDSPLRKLYGDDNGDYDRAAGLDNRAGGGKNYTVFAGSSGVVGYFALAADTPYLTADEFSTKDFSGWVNGAPALAKVPAVWEDALPNLYLGGTGTSYNEFWDGDLAEILVYARLLSDEERMRAEDYLAARYGLKLNRVGK